MGKYGQKVTFNDSVINFGKTCPYCKQVVCNGTTLATFCCERIDFGEEDEDEDDAEEAFVNAYIFVKDFEKFQNTRYTNPDVQYKWSTLPQCVLDTFREHFREGQSKFNMSRLAMKTNDQKKK